MYEIIVVINGKEHIVETVHNIVTASHFASFHRQKGYQAYYRAVVRRVA